MEKVTEMIKKSFIVSKETSDIILIGSLGDFVPH